MCRDDKARIKRERLWDAQAQRPSGHQHAGVRHPWVPVVLAAAILALVAALEWTK